MRADIGIALDGDADRVLIVDERGHLVDGDQLMGVVATQLARGQASVAARHRRDHHVQSRASSAISTASDCCWRAPPSAIAMCSNTCASTAIISAASNPATSSCRTTRRPGDGLVAALQLLAVVKRTEKPVSEVCHCFEPLPQILKNVRYKNGEPLAEENVVTAIESGRGRLGNQGRLVIRPSGTESVIRVMGEGDDRDLVERVVDDIVEALTKAA